MKLFTLTIFVCCTVCTHLFSQQIPIPSEYEIVTSVLGDLDEDGVDELVVVYNKTTANEEDDESIPRELRIYKREGLKWVDWHKSDQVLYGSRDGGMMVDPLDGVDIQDGVLIVRQFGGGRFKWGITDQYRYQDCGFFLVHYAHLSGAPCEFWESVDFDLSSGKIKLSTEVEVCDDKYDYGDGVDVENFMEEFYSKGHKVKMEYRRESYLLIMSPNNRELRVE